MSLRIEDGSVRTVTLDRPDRANALSADLVDDLHHVLDRAEADPPEVLVLRGNARHFASGLDLGGLEREDDASLTVRMLRIGLLLERWGAAPCLTVAVVEGAAVGAGADLALACDHRLAGPAASFRFPGPGFGVVLGTARLLALGGSLDLLGGTRVAAADAGPLVTGVPADLDDVVAGWRVTHRVARPGLLAASRRRSADADQALAALTRSVVVPGLHDRVRAHTARVLTKEPA